MIFASYEPMLDPERAQRIRAALKRRRVRFGRNVDADSQELDWTAFHDTCNDLRISIPGGEETHGRGDPQQRARRLASDLRACGMAVTIERYALFEIGGGMNRQQRRAAMRQARKDVSRPGYTPSQDRTFRDGISKIVRAVDFGPYNFCLQRALMAREVLRHCRIDASLQLGSLLLSGRP
jgi:hypothetical protein